MLRNDVTLNPPLKSVKFVFPVVHKVLTLPIPIPYEERKLAEILIFTVLFGASKGFMKVFWGTTKKCENKHISLCTRPKMIRKGTLMANKFLQFQAQHIYVFLTISRGLLRTIWNINPIPNGVGQFYPTCCIFFIVKNWGGSVVRRDFSGN